jgi:hypothetical protein
MAIPSAAPRDGAPAARHDRSAFAAPRVGGEIVSLLDVDPELGRRLSRDDLPAARPHLMVAVEQVANGPWAPLPRGRRSPLGYLLLEGTLLHTARVEQRHGAARPR